MAMFLCIPCANDNCDDGEACKSRTGESIGILCEHECTTPKARVVKRPTGTRVVKRPRSMQ